MLNINPDTVCSIIQKYQEFHAKEEVSIPHDQEMDVDDDWAMQALADHIDDPTLQEVNVIDGLGPEFQVELVGMMWLGRGDFTIAEWESALDEALDAWTPRPAEYLAATPLVADYLAEGLRAFGFGCDE